MLNKSICQKCVESHTLKKIENSKNKPAFLTIENPKEYLKDKMESFEKHWLRNLCTCPVKYNFICEDVHGKPPLDCIYRLEQVLIQNAQ